ncbi:MAG: TIR domain-containing protein [Methanoregula sp.]
MKNIRFLILFLIFFFVPLTSAASPLEIYTTNVLHGDALFNNGSYASAKDAYLSATPFIRGNISILTPPPAELYYRIGLCEMNLGNYPNAQENFDTSLRQNPDPGLKNIIFQEKANTSLFMQKFPEAEGFFISSGMSPASAAARVENYRIAHDRSYVPMEKNAGAGTAASGASGEPGNITVHSPAAGGSPGENTPAPLLPAEMIIGISLLGLCGGLIAVFYYRKAGSFSKTVRTNKEPHRDNPATNPDPPPVRYPAKKQSGHPDVFISYSHRDKPVSDAICAHLEARGIRCWIAPRDVSPGEHFPGAIITAIEQSRMMVLVFSASSNESPHVIRELNKAVSLERVIIPFRIEEAPLSRSMEYLIGLPHWLDAMTPPLEEHLIRLSTTIESILKNG